MLKPMLSAIRSITSSSSFLGNKADTRVYPGKNNTNGKPTAALNDDSLSGGTVMMITDAMVNAITAIRSFGAVPFSDFPGMLNLILELKRYNHCHSKQLYIEKK